GRTDRAPQAAPSAASETMPAAMSESAPVAASETTPAATSETAPIAASETTPAATSETAPVAASETAPVAETVTTEPAGHEPPIVMPEHESEAQALTEAALPDESAPEAGVDRLVEAAAPPSHQESPATEQAQGEAAP
ncbi:MAG: hypothetical protein WCD38_00660, partial [Candidatus Tumulicola sp.]